MVLKAILDLLVHRYAWRGSGPWTGLEKQLVPSFGLLLVCPPINFFYLNFIVYVRIIHK